MIESMLNCELQDIPFNNIPVSYDALNFNLFDLSKTIDQVST